MEKNDIEHKNNWSEYGAASKKCKPIFRFRTTIKNTNILNIKSRIITICLCVVFCSDTLLYIALAAVIPQCSPCVNAIYFFRICVD